MLQRVDRFKVGDHVQPMRLPVQSSDGKHRIVNKNKKTLVVCAVHHKGVEGSRLFLAFEGIEGAYPAFRFKKAE